MNLATIALGAGLVGLAAYGFGAAVVTGGVYVERHLRRKRAEAAARAERVAGERAVIDAFHADPAVIEALRIAGGTR